MSPGEAIQVAQSLPGDPIARVTSLAGVIGALGVGATVSLLVYCLLGRLRRMERAIEEIHEAVEAKKRSGR